MSATLTCHRSAPTRRGAATGTSVAVISVDNSLPHLLTDLDLERAVDSIRACLRDEGIFIATIRDDDSLRTTLPAGVPIALHGESGSRLGAGQSWAGSADAEHIAIALLTSREQAAGAWAVSAHETRYRALRRERLSQVLKARGSPRPSGCCPSRAGTTNPWSRRSPTGGVPEPRIRCNRHDLQ